MNSSQISLTKIDFAAVAASMGDLRNIVDRDLGHQGRSGKYPCPFHGGGQERTPSLQVYEDHFFCYSCQARGDALHWRAKFDGLNLIQAAKVVDPSIITVEDLKGWKGDPFEVVIPPDIKGKGESESSQATPRPESPEIWKQADWQSAVDEVVVAAEDALWSPVGAEALEWLRARCLADHTIRRFRLGFIPEDFWTGPIDGLINKKGKPRGLYAPRGIAIPKVAPASWYSPREEGTPSGPRWVGLNVRRLADPVLGPLPDDVRKCQMLKGSRLGHLYPWPEVLTTQGVRPFLMVEGEFDALVAEQEAGHIVQVGTPGSSSASIRNPQPATAQALAVCSWLLLGFDCDKAGSEAARIWFDAYPHKARRAILPIGKDLTDFAKAGGNVAQWVKTLIP